eukprot:scaffold7307_cov125-Isochrysis_galbana.AAC.3
MGPRQTCTSYVHIARFVYRMRACGTPLSVCPYLLPPRPRTHWLFEDVRAGMLVVQEASDRACRIQWDVSVVPHEGCMRGGLYPSGRSEGLLAGIHRSMLPPARPRYGPGGLAPFPGNASRVGFGILQTRAAPVCSSRPHAVSDGERQVEPRHDG